MPKDPHKTVEFPGVRPVSVPPSAAPVPSSASRMPAASRPSFIPEWGSDEDVSTARTTEQTISIPPPPSVRDRALVTLLTGLNAGQVFTLDADETFIGRSREAHVRIDDVGISRKHARIVRAQDGRYIVEDLRSTNGVFVNGRKIERAELATGDRVQVGPTVVVRFGLIDEAEESLARQLYESSTRDSLTRAFNRKYLTERLTAEVAYAQRHKGRLAVVLFDLDHFKRANDSYGHLAGDVVLRVVSSQVQRLIRTEDVFARYGGEEFVVLVRGIEHANVTRFAERLRKSIERLVIPWETRTLKVTVSLGVASLSECEPQTPDGVLRVADERLYRAKSQGRNRVCST
jgi:two-component system cell cycle response regulator